MRKETGTAKLQNLLGSLVVVVLVLMPFHTFFTTWLGSNFNHFDLFRIWKDILLLLMVGLGIYLLIKDQSKWAKLKHNPLFYLIIGYVALLVILGICAGLAGHVNANALLYGWLSDGRFLVFFLVAYVAGVATKPDSRWIKWLLIPGSLVIAFGLAQHFILPNNFLSHFGYSRSTIPAYQAVDLKTAYVRVQSTLRGPNPLGAYLVVISTAVIALWLRYKNQRRLWALLGVATAAALFFTYSRSAWIGAVLAALVVCWLSIRSEKIRMLFAGCLIGLALVFGTGLVLFRNNDHVQNTFFHSDEHSVSSKSSNQVRATALKTGLNDIWHEPLGRGPGTAGPASERNDHTPRIAENYYLQIGQEFGWLGLILFLAINIEVARQLWQKRTDLLALVLLASFVGLTFINLLSHAWADDTLALVWWGLAGLALAPVILNKKRKHNVWTKEKAT